MNYMMISYRDMAYCIENNIVNEKNIHLIGNCCLCQPKQLRSKKKQVVLHIIGNSDESYE